ncbi:MAG: YggT family protein [Anaerolineales bacterium]
MTTNNIDIGPEDRREKVVLQQKGGFERKEHIVEDKGFERQLMTVRFTRFIYLAFGALESLIGLRIILKLLAANPSNPFAAFIYQLTDLFLKPFAGLVSNPAIGGMVLELTSMIGMLVYGLMGLGVIQLVNLVFFQTRARTISTYDKKP